MKSSGADVRLTCTPKCFGVYVMASCTALFQVLLVFTSPRLTWSYALVLSLSRRQKEGKRGSGRAGVGTQRVLCLPFSYGFLQACILNTLYHYIFSYLK